MDRGYPITLVWVPQYDWARLNALSVTTLGLVMGVAAATGQLKAIDAIIYWQADLDALYQGWGGWVYPPPLAQVLAVLHALPWAVFVTAWMTLVFATAWYFMRWLTLPVFALGAIGYAIGIPILTTLLGWALLGNVQYPMLAAIVLGLRHPEAWPFAILSKIGPAIGLLALPFSMAARAVLITGIVCVVSFVLAPHLWFEWAAWMLGPHGDSGIPVVDVPYPARLAAGVLLCLSARNGRLWLVPLACGLSLPALYEASILPFIVASFVLWVSQSVMSRRTPGVEVVVKGGVT